MAGHVSANWYPDPFGRSDFRYWDGRQWTENVATGGQQGIDPPIASPPAPTANRASTEVQRHEGGVDGVGPQARRDALFTEPELVVKQKAKGFEVKAEYAVYDKDGRPLADVREVGHSFMNRAIMGRRYYQDQTHRLEVVDTFGRVLIRLNRPSKFLRSKMLVTDGSGTQIGEIRQKTLDLVAVVGTKVHFSLESGGRPVGSITANNLGASDCDIRDATGNEIAVITRKWAAKSMFTKADNYVLRIQRPLEEPLRSLVIASVFAVDTALRQGNFDS
jgi:uncharacterized protein YxjI